MKGHVMSLQSVQGKTRSFYVLNQEYLYQDNVNDAPAIAARRAMLTLGVAYASAATTLIGVAHGVGFL